MSIRQGSGWGLFIALGLLMSGCAGPSVIYPKNISSPSSTMSVNIRCVAHELRAQLLMGQGATQNILQQVMLTNIGEKSCTLVSYPAISLKNHGLLPIKTIDGNLVVGTGVPGKIKSVKQTLKPLGKAWFWLLYPTTNTDGNVSCPQSSLLVIGLPYGRGRLTVPAVIPDCQGMVEVSPFVA